jgi:predicted ester cyclase
VQLIYDGLFAAFPDFHADADALRHGDDHVLVEARMSGTQHADWAGIPNTGRSFIVLLAAMFDLDGDQLQCERAYFDLGEIARQLTS